jgi:putative heme-binding domain-containing protein
LALARVASPAEQPELLAALDRLPLEKLDRETLLTALRAYALSFTRQGRPGEELCRKVAVRLASLYPHAASVVNQELCELLVYLNSPGAIDLTLDLLEAAPSQEEQIHYAQALLQASEWTLQSRRRILDWLQRARSFRGGKLLPTVIGQMRTDLIHSLTDQERRDLVTQIAALETPVAEIPAGPPRPLVRHWLMEDFAAQAQRPLIGRSFEGARIALAAAACLKCHRIGDQGGAVGPDLTLVGRRYDERALLESILVPSKEIDPKYRDTAYILDDGKVVIGRPVQVDAARIVVETDPLTQAMVTISRTAIDETQPAQVSPMPTGLADVLTRDEVLDLVAYLKSGGDAQNPSFHPTP